MGAEQAREWLIEFACDGIDPAREAEFLASLAADPALAAEWAEIQAVDGLLARVPATAPDEALMAAVRAGIGQAIDAASQRRPWYAGRLNLAAGGAAACLLIGLLAVGVRPPHEPTGSDTAAMPRPAAEAPTAAAPPRVADAPAPALGSPPVAPVAAPDRAPQTPPVASPPPAPSRVATRGGSKPAPRTVAPRPTPPRRRTTPPADDDRRAPRELRADDPADHEVRLATATADGRPSRFPEVVAGEPVLGVELPGRAATAPAPRPAPPSTTPSVVAADESPLDVAPVVVMGRPAAPVVVAAARVIRATEPVLFALRPSSPPMADASPAEAEAAAGLAVESAVIENVLVPDGGLAGRETR